MFLNIFYVYAYVYHMILSYDKFVWYSFGFVYFASTHFIEVIIFLPIACKFFLRDLTCVFIIPFKILCVTCMIFRNFRELFMFFHVSYTLMI